MTTERTSYVPTSTAITDDSCNTIQLTSAELTAVVASPATYDTIEITVQKNCCDDLIYTDEITITGAAPFAGTHSTLAADNTLTINPTIVDADFTAFEDGVYSITVKTIKQNADYVIEEQCIPLMCSLKCQIAEKDFTENFNLHVAYFTLIAGSGCPCACDNLCELYEYILTQLNMETTSICESC